MSWMEQLEYLEKDEENKKAERKNENVTETKEIETKEDLESSIEDILNTYKIVKEMQEMGLDDAKAAMEITQQRIKKLINIGTKKSLLSQEEILDLYEKVGIKKLEKDNEEVNNEKKFDEQKIGKATINTINEKKDEAYEKVTSKVNEREQSETTR